MTPARYAPVVPLPACPWCRHPWVAHWSDDGCQAATGPSQTCGCREPPPDPAHRPDPTGDPSEDPASMPATPAAHIARDVARHGTRAERARLPLARDVLEAVAVDHGVCIRPLPMRRTDPDTGETEIIPAPCGATLASKCPPCAERARKLRMAQCAAGWHLDDEPVPDPDPPTDDQRALMALRADYEAARAEADDEADAGQVADLDDAISEVDAELSDHGVRGSAAPTRRDRPRRTRSTRRRQDAPDLPRLPVERRTVGRTYTAPDGAVWRPSLFLTLTCDSYGRVGSDGTPVDPGSYDYRRAARDAIHFPKLLDRFWQNLRRAVGWDVQYFAALEPQRRLAPHVHAAIRGTIPRTVLRQVAAATYHQVWWPPCDTVVYGDDRLPVWDEATGSYLDPTTGAALPSWNEALDDLDSVVVTQPRRDDQEGQRDEQERSDQDGPGPNPQGERAHRNSGGTEDERCDTSSPEHARQSATGKPLHVVRFGAQLRADGVNANDPNTGRLIGYLAKYLTKNLDACHAATTDAQRAHVDRLATALRYEPCSPRCANWLRYGIQSAAARPGLVPGCCKGRAHRRETLGFGGRRVLVSRRWSGKTLADHRADRRAWVREQLATLAHPPGGATGPAGPAEPRTYISQLLRPGDPAAPRREHLLLRAVADRVRWQADLTAARIAAGHPPGAPAAA